MRMKNEIVVIHETNPVEEAQDILDVLLGKGVLTVIEPKLDQVKPGETVIGTMTPREKSFALAAETAAANKETLIMTALRSVRVVAIETLTHMVEFMWGLIECRIPEAQGCGVLAYRDGWQITATSPAQERPKPKERTLKAAPEPENPERLTADEIDKMYAETQGR